MTVLSAPSTSLLDDLPIGIAVLDQDLRYTYVNSTLAAVNGRPPAEHLGRLVTEVIPNLGPRIAPSLRRVLETGEPVPEHLVRGSKVDEDGQAHSFRLQFAPVRGTAGEVAGVSVLVFDQTQRRRDEALLHRAEQALRLFVEHAPAAIALFDTSMVYLAASRRYLDDFHLAGAKVVGRSHYDVFPEIPERWREIHRRCLAGAVEQCEEDPFPRADGTVDWLRWEMHPWYEREDVIGGVVLTCEVITARKRAQDALRESEARHRTQFETMAQGVVYQDASGAIISANQAAERILGLTLDQLQGRTSMDPRWRAIHEDGSPFEGETHPGMVALRTGEEVRRAVMGVLHPGAKEYRWIRIQAVPLFRPGETKPFQVYALFDDFTEERRARKDLELAHEGFGAGLEIARRALREETAKAELRARELAVVVEESTDGFVAVDLATGKIELSEASAKLARLVTSAPEPSTEASFDRIHPDDAERMRAAYLALREGRATRLDEEHRVMVPGGWKWLRARGSVVAWDEQGKPLRIAGILIDTDEQHRAQDRLLQDARLRGLSERINEIELVVRPDGSIVEANDRALAAYGYDREELLALNIRDLRAPATRSNIPEKREQALQPGGVRFETEHQRRDGTTFPVEVSSRPFEVGGEKYMHSLVLDRTEAQRADAERQASHEQLSMVLLATREGFWDLDLTTGRRIHSARVARMLGVEPADLGTTNEEWWQRAHPEDVPRLRSALAALVENHTESFDVEYRVRTGDGAWLRVKSRGKAVDWDRTGKPTRVVGTLSEAGASPSELATELAQSRKLVDELYRSKESAWLSFATASIGLAHAGLDGRIRRMNRRACEIFGYADDEAHGMPLADLVHPEDRALSDEPLRDLAAGKRASATIERRYLRKDGAVVWCRVIVSMLPDEQGRPEHFLAVIEDITARREAEEKLRLLSDHALFGVAMLQDDRMVFANQALADITGYPLSEMQGWSVAECERLVYPADVPSVRDQARRRRAEPGAVIYHRHRLITKTGAIRGVTQVSHAVRHRGRMADLLMVLDTTGMAQVEAPPAHKPRLDAPLMAHARDAIHIVDRRGKLREFNPAFAAHLGYSPEELRGMSAADWDAQLCQAEIEEAIARQIREPGRFATRHRRKDGTVRDVEIECGPIEEGGEMLLYAAARDVTDRKRAEDAGRGLWRIMEQAPVTIVMTDPDGNIEYVNPALERSTGYTAAELHGKNPQALESGKTDPATRAAVWQTIRAGQVWRGDVHTRKKNGDEILEDATIFPLHDAAGSITHFLGILLDVTRERAAQRELARLAAELEQRVAERTAELDLALRGRDAFLAAISHELRTPLNAVLGLSEALEESTYGAIAPRQREVLRKIESSGRHLLGLITDILDVSKIDAGTLALDLRPVRADELCQASLRMVQESATRKAQTLSLAVDDGLGAILADGPRLKQILVNLLGNAVKFTPPGGSIELSAAAEGDTLVRFAVRDTGIGIAPEDVARAFQPFVQLDASLARAQAGTGLGLALVQRLAALHGGKVAVESEPGVGSRFSVILPKLGARA